MKFLNFIVTAAMLGLSIANPVAFVEERQLICVINVVLVNLLTLNNGAGFCSSYLNIQTSTVLQTTTATATVTSLVTATKTDVVTVTSTTTRSVGMRLKERQNTPTPTYLNGFDAAQISAACECLNLQTPITTATATAINTLTTTISNTVTVSSTQTVVVTQSPVPTDPCSNPEVIGPNYRLQLMRSNIVQNTQAVSALNCCQICWRTSDCFGFAYNAAAALPCTYRTGTGTVNNPLTPPPARCPRGVSKDSQFVQMDGAPYGLGPCDVQGIPFIPV